MCYYPKLSKTVKVFFLYFLDFKFFSSWINRPLDYFNSVYQIVLCGHNGQFLKKQFNPKKAKLIRNFGNSMVFLSPNSPSIMHVLHVPDAKKTKKGSWMTSTWRQITIECWVKHKLSDCVIQQAWAQVLPDFLNSCSSFFFIWKLPNCSAKRDGVEMF